MSKSMEAAGVSAWFGSTKAIENVSLSVEAKQVTAVIGPSGCGKSTFLRTLNRMHEVVPGARMDGQVLLDGDNIYGSGVDATAVRRTVGMVFQRPNPFPTMSIRDNVVSGLRLNGQRRKAELDGKAEHALRQTGLWGEVSRRVGDNAGGLSGGQQQRLCIARAIAVEPEVLLMDEPCSALDPISTLIIEDLIGELKDTFTIVIVTHNLQQAARVSDATGFFTINEAGQPGHLVEIGPTSKMFTSPSEERTEAYITGRFG
jgi:phosphate transport system ATP-binding protein